MINNIFSFVQVIILDIRAPSSPMARLYNHRAAVNGITWAPHSSCHICTAGGCAIGRVLPGLHACIIVRLSYNTLVYVLITVDLA